MSQNTRQAWCGRAVAVGLRMRDSRGCPTGTNSTVYVYTWRLVRCDRQPCGSSPPLDILNGGRQFPHPMLFWRYTVLGAALGTVLGRPPARLHLTPLSNLLALHMLISSLFTSYLHICFSLSCSFPKRPSPRSIIYLCHTLERVSSWRPSSSSSIC